MQRPIIAITPAQSSGVPMDHILRNEADLRAYYADANPGAVKKQLDHIDLHCASLIALSPFVTIGSTRDGALPDVSPRGGEPGFVTVANPHTLHLPDWPGNNRLDSLSNIAVSGTVALLFFIPGFNDMLRVNGSAQISVDPAITGEFTMRGRSAKSVMVVRVQEAYLHCTKALVRSKLWQVDSQQPRSMLPSTGTMYRDQMALKDVPPEAIDASLAQNEKDDLY